MTRAIITNNQGDKTKFEAQTQTEKKDEEYDKEKEATVKPEETKFG